MVWFIIFLGKECRRCKEAAAGGVVVMTESQTDVLISKITDYTGIRVAPVLVDYVSVYVDKKAASRGISSEEYYSLLEPGADEFNELITEITTNETYFFREERQFRLLKEKVFPQFAGRKMVIWSAASASGEEAVSLYALAASCGVTPKIYATDIDQNELSFFRRGVYPRTSFCEDGKEFRPLLVSSGCGLFDGDTFRLHPSFVERLEIHNYNLVGDSPLPMAEPVHLIFLRNVFIYFDEELRKAVLKKLSSVLAPGGMIFLSFTEIGSIGTHMIPAGMEKKRVGPVCFLVKKNFFEYPAPVTASRTVPRAVWVSSQHSEPAVPPVAVAATTPTPASEERSVTVKPMPAIRAGLVDSVSTGGCRSEAEAAETPPTACPMEPPDVFRLIKKLVRCGDIPAARAEAYAYHPSEDKKMYVSFFKAYLERSCGNFSQAEYFYSAVEDEHSHFWPAYFYHGIMLKEIGRDKDATKYFEKCARLLEEYENSGSTEFDFIDEAFSPDYFYVLCLKFMRIWD